MGSMNEPMWKVPDSLRISIAEWGENAVVYQSVSGETHQLNALLVETLKLFQSGPLTLEALIDRLRCIFDVEDEVDLRQQIEQLILQFENLGLIEQLIRED